MNDARGPLDRLPQGRGEWPALLQELGIRPSRGMGQNFLVEHGVVDRIVRTAGICPGDIVVEVGPGLGMLTGHLLDAGARVAAIELDRNLASYLRHTFGDLPHASLVEGDALGIPIDQIVSPDVRYKVVANLPYSIASAILMRFLEQHHQPDSMTVMVQREVADRIVATPPNMSILSVAIQVLAEPTVAFTVSPGSFMPPPKIESAVLTLRPIGEARLSIERRPQFFELVNAGFRHRRKQLLNSLAFELEFDKPEIASRLTEAGIDPMRRAQTLGVDEWLAVERAWKARG